MILTFPLLYPVQEHDSPAADRIWTILDQVDTTLAGLASQRELTREDVIEVTRTARERLFGVHYVSREDADYMRAALQWLDSLR